jgi:glycosyltransferase involved in cell wall biosynthesis
MNEPKYSIIIPHYNDYEGLNRLLASLPKRNDIEGIIIDDNSNINDNSFSELAAKFPFLNLKFLLNTKGVKGAGACRNLGLETINGEYVLFADADDFFLPIAFDILDNVLNDAPGNDIYYFKPTSKCLVTGKVSDRHITYSDLIDSYLNGENEDIKHEFYVPWSKLYLAKFINDNNCTFDEVIASNDVMFSVKSSFLAKKFKAYSDSIYCVTRGKGTLTVNRSKNIELSRLHVLIRKSEFIFENKINVTKESVVGLIRDYFKILDLSIFNILIKSFSKGYLSFFPKSYYLYIKSPNMIIQRIKRKNKLSVDDKKYH